jgi:hypothetical protein
MGSEYAVSRLAEPIGTQHAWTMTQPSTEGREAFRCLDCGLVVEHFWGTPFHKTSMLLHFAGGPMRLPLSECKS